MSELRSQISTKLNSFDSEGKTISAFGLTQAKKATKSKPRFMDFAIEYSQVRRSLLTRVLFLTFVEGVQICHLGHQCYYTKELLGLQSKFSVDLLPYVETFFPVQMMFKLYVDIKKFIFCRRYETLSLHHVLQRFSSSDCEWLMPPGDGHEQKRVSLSDASKRRELLEDFLFWFFDSFLISLLRVRFRVTLHNINSC